MVMCLLLAACRVAQITYLFTYLLTFELYFSGCICCAEMLGGVGSWKEDNNKCHRQTDRQTDGQQDDTNSRSYCVAVRSAKKWLAVDTVIAKISS